MILLPSHPCLPGADGAVPYGDLDARNVATCRERVLWDRGVRLPGCGSRIAVCHGCGLRTRINAGRCERCGGEERPEVVNAGRVVEAMRSDDDKGGIEGGGPGVGLERSPSAEVVRLPGPGPGAVVPGNGAGQGDAGARRQTKEKAPTKPRAARKAVKKGAATPDEELPLFK